MRKSYTLSAILAIAIFHTTLAQTNIFPSTGAAGIGTLTPDASSLLEIKSTTKGILIPRMTGGQRNAIVSPATGLMVYQTNGIPGFYYYSGTAWTAITTKAGWSLTGNAGTDSISFIGTTDAQSLIFKVNNTWAGILDNSTYNTGTRNTAFGLRSLYSNTSGLENTAIGYGTLYSNQSGNDNSAFGKYALFTNTQGSYNIALGYNALYFNTTGNHNTATGSVALQNNTTSSNNTANGYAALYSNNGGAENTGLGVSTLYANVLGNDNTATGFAALNSNTANNNTATGAYALYTNQTGGFNTATGAYALYLNTTGGGNTANGYWALYTNSTGIFNTATGNYALSTNLTGNNNTANGYQSLYQNTTGNDNAAVGFEALWANTTGNSNTAIGKYALYANNTGYSNTATGNSALLSNYSGHQNMANGDSALYSNTTGNYNTAAGFKSLHSNIAGSSNTANGSLSLYSNTTGHNNVAVGDTALYSNTTGYNNTVVGSRAAAGNIGGSNNVALGFNASVGDNVSYATAIGAGTGISISHTMRFGNVNVQHWMFGNTFYSNGDAITVGGLPTDGNGAYLTTGGVWTDISDRKKKEDFKQIDPYIILAKISQLEVTKWKYKGINEYHYGPMADDFHRLFEVGDDSSTSTMDKTGILFLGMKAIISENENLKTQIQSQQKQIDDLKTLILSVWQKQESCSPCNTSGATAQTYNTVITDGASLQQNVPNPFSHSTTIGYTLPQKFTTAQIMITDKRGKTLKLVNISGSGKGNLNVDASVLASSAYDYSLYVDGKLIGTKQMVLAK